MATRTRAAMAVRAATRTREAMTVRAAVTLSTMLGAAMASPSPTLKWLTSPRSWGTMMMRRSLHLRSIQPSVSTSISSPSPSHQRWRLSSPPLTRTGRL